MNKATKIIVVLMLLSIVIYIVTGVNTKIKNKQNNDQSGDALISGDNLEENELDIHYEVSSGENEVVLKGTSEGSVSITTYQFEDGILTDIILEEIITSGDAELIENIFNYMRNDTEMSMVYSTIDMEGNTITAVLRDEYVDAYGEATKVEVYEELMKSLNLKNN